MSQFAESLTVPQMTGTAWIGTFDARLPLAESAAEYARHAHAGQFRADGSEFILHPLEVGWLLLDVGAPDHLVAAGVLHDVLEKSAVRVSELRKRFGGRVAGLVAAVSDDDRIAGYGKRKAALRRQVAGAGEEALALFAADKLSKLRELHRESVANLNEPDAPARRRELRARRLRHYQRSLALLEERLSDSPLVRDLRDELHAYLRQRATPAGGR
jgi:(p)ppGpp synthase/HD superfamily hydrolase